MNIGKRQIDHIVYCVHDLEAAVVQFSEVYGVHPVMGGRHLNRGTHNAIVNLGNECYLEILAVDDNNTAVTRDRWMGIDYLKEPKMTRWSLRSDNLKQDLLAIEKLNPDLCNLSVGQRMTPAGSMLKWNMSIPLSSPEVELLPFLLDWTDSDNHPTQDLAQECELIGMELFHPSPEKLLPCYKELGISMDVLPSVSTRIKATLKGPKGVFVL